MNCFIGVERFFLSANQLRSIIRYRRYSPALARISSLQVSIFFSLFIASIRFFHLDRVLLAVAGRTSVALKSPSSAIEDGGMLFRGRSFAPRRGYLERSCFARHRVYPVRASIYILSTWKHIVAGVAGVAGHPSLPRVQLYIRKYIFWACSRQRSA